MQNATPMRLIPEIFAEDVKYLRASILLFCFFYYLCNINA